MLVIIDTYKLDNLKSLFFPPVSCAQISIIISLIIVIKELQKGT